MKECVIEAPRSKVDFTAATLPAHPLFNGLADKYKAILADCAMQASFEPGDSVFEAGEPANCFYLVTQGSIALQALGLRASSSVQIIQTGEILGWSWLFPPYYWHFNALAQEPTEAIFFYGSRLRQQSDRNHDFGYELLKRLSTILMGHLQANRQRWIQAVQLAPFRGGLPTDYFII
ncbi:MAG TPA: Crp/Fnr family transcriptional regulator [Candidatus Saccharimonadales bacterium]|nr:Crp/Fnr family transcriptional regulator [Candidatus Saccharimonadales bacterium]